MRIIFLDLERSGRPRQFDFSDAETLRGGERGLLYLAGALAKRGHEITVATRDGAADIVQQSVRFVSMASARSGVFDVAISNNYAFAFDGIHAPIKIVWTRNPGFSVAHLKADFLGKLRHRPHIVHLSRYTRRRSWFLPRAGSSIIHHGVPPELLGSSAPRTDVPSPVALFSSYASRNLSLVVDAWRRIVHPALPHARLEVTAEVAPKHANNLPDAELAASGIHVLGSLPWSELMERMRQSRVMLVPGHFQETYNNLAIESAAAGLPCITLGIGALGERVKHDQTGWVAGNVEDMGRSIVRVLTDDALWRRYHLNCFKHPDLVSWDDRAVTWENCFAKLQANRPWRCTLGAPTPNPLERPAGVVPPSTEQTTELHELST